MGYNKEQDAFIKAFKKSETIDKKALCLFFLKENTTHSDIKGHMPFNRSFGFIYAANQSITELTRTMAHELGHGAFRLKHTFSNENKFVQIEKQTPNLMDYASGSELLKYQWDECHDFDLGCNWFEDGDEAESSSSSVSCSCSSNGDCSIILNKYLSPIKEAYNKNTTAKIYATSLLSGNVNINGTCYPLTVMTSNYSNGVSINSKTDITNRGRFIYGTYSYHYYGIEYGKYLKIGIYYQVGSSDAQTETNAKAAQVQFDKVADWLFSGTGSITDKELVSVDLLKQIFDNPKNTDFIKTVQPYLNTYMNKFNINTPLRIAHFLAQIGYETQYFAPDKLEENLNYSACLIKKTFCKKCYNTKEDCPTVTTCNDCSKKYPTSKYNENRADMCLHPGNYAHKPNKISMAAYSGYKGRGFIQLTLKSNYTDIYNYLLNKGCSPKDYISNPEYLSDDYETAAMSACAFFRKNGCNAQADNDDFDGVMNIVNKHDSDAGKAARNVLLVKIKGIMNIK